MHEIQIHQNKKRLYMPENLGECDNNQFAFMSDLFHQYQTQKISYEQLRYNAVYHLLNLKKGDRKTLSQPERDRMEANIYQISTLVDSFFFHEEVEDKTQITLSQNFRHNPMKHIPLLKGKLTGPRDNFEGMTFGQYLDALDKFGNFVQDPDIDLLYELCATLYQKGKYSPKKTKATIKLLKANYFGYVYGAYLLFTTFQQVINNSLIMIEGNLCDLSVLFEKPKNYKKYTSYPSIGMKSTAFVLAESGVFGTYKDVRNAHLWDIFARLYDLKVRDAETEKQLEEQERKRNKNK